jgi:tetratricopeptide (TPR) repeat protein
MIRALTRSQSLRSADEDNPPSTTPDKLSQNNDGHIQNSPRRGSPHGTDEGSHNYGIPPASPIQSTPTNSLTNNNNSTSPKTSKSLTFDMVFDGVFEKRGIKLSHLKSIPFRPGSTTADMRRNFFHTVTAQTKQSYASYLLQTSPDLVSDKIDSVIIHTYKQTWEHVLNSLPIDDGDNPDRFVWFDIACLSLHDNGVENPVSEFRDFLDSVPRIEVILVPVHQPLSLNRTWVNFEMILGYTRGKRVDLRYVQSQVEAMRHSFAKQTKFDFRESLSFLKNFPVRAMDQFNCTFESDFKGMIGTLRASVSTTNLRHVADFYHNVVFTTSTINGVQVTPMEDLRLQYAKAYCSFLAGNIERGEKEVRDSLLFIDANDGLGNEKSMALHLLGEILMGNPKKTTQALDVYLSVPNPTDFTWMCAGKCLYELRRYKDAITYFEKALTQRRKTYPVDDAHPEVGDALHWLGRACFSDEKLNKAKPYLEEAINIRRANAVAHPEAFADSLCASAEVAIMLKDYNTAKSYASQATTIRTTVFGFESAPTLEAQAILGATLMQMGKLEDARPILYRVMESRKRVLGREHTNTLESMVTMAQLLRNEKRYEESSRMLEQVLELRKKVFGPESFDVVKTMDLLAMAFFDRGLESSGKGLGFQAIELARKIQKRNPHSIPDNYIENLTEKWEKADLRRKGRHR